MLQCVAVCCSTWQCDTESRRRVTLLDPVSPRRIPRISRLLKIKGLLCRISSLLCGSFAKETYNFKEPTSRSNHLLLFPSFFEYHGTFSHHLLFLPRHHRISLPPHPRHNRTPPTLLFMTQTHTTYSSFREVGGWGRDPKKCTGRDWGMGSSTI